MMYVYFYHATCRNESGTNFINSSGLLRFIKKIIDIDDYNEAKILIHNTLPEEYKLDDIVMKSLTFLHEAEE